MHTHLHTHVYTCKTEWEEVIPNPFGEHHLESLQVFVFETHKHCPGVAPPCREQVTERNTHVVLGHALLYYYCQ